PLAAGATVLIVAIETSATTVNSLKVEQPMSWYSGLPSKEKRVVQTGITPLPWVARTATHRLVLPDLQNSHSPHSAVYSGITWSPGLTLVTPSPTSTTTPPPSWPSTTGNSPSGSAPDSVNASVWHSAVWVIFTSTSPLRGGSTSISTICSGWSGAKATAARDFMAGLLGGSFEVGTDQRGHFVDPRTAAVGIARRLLELLAQVRLEHLAHQPVDRTADRRDLLQHRRTVGTGLERALEPLALAADAADAGEDLLFFRGAMWHGRWAWIVGGSISQTASARDVAHG